jgi:hypothetical protein
MIGIAGALLFLIIVFIGIFLLQVYLAKSENSWTGLILPIASFCLSLMAVMGMAGYNVFRKSGPRAVAQESATAFGKALAPLVKNIPEIMTPLILIFLLLNIPTAIFMAIYASFRVKRNRRNDSGIIELRDI